MSMIWRIIIISVLASYSIMVSATPMKCTLSGSADHFWFYQEQLVYESNQFVIFQNFKGRVVTQVDLKTNQLIRTTYIGEPFEPEYQILRGSCKDAAHVLNFWTMSKTPFDQ